MPKDASDANSNSNSNSNTNSNSNSNTNTNSNSNTNTNSNSNPMVLPPAEPEVEEVRKYCEKNGYSLVDAGEFVAYYRARDWMVGSSPMRDWRAMVDIWDKKAREKAPRTVSAVPSPDRAIEQMERLERLRKQMRSEASA